MPLNVRKYLKFVVPFLAGFLLGWLVVGWWLWPVRWVNTDPWDLRLEFKRHYILMAADSYALDGNADVLKERFRGWPPGELAAIIAELKRENPGDVRLASRLDQLKGVLNLPEPGVTPPAPQPPAAGKGPGIISILLLISAFLIILIAVGIGYRLLKERLPKVPARPARRPPRPEPQPRVMEGEYRQVSPIAHYSATYNYGDIRFSESFPIESPDGKYLGECGIETSELLSSGDPPKVVAFEVWLFDKEVNRTVSKAITVPGADETLKASLLSFSGEVKEARKGEVVKLETQNLEAQVAIREAAFEDEEKYFTRLAVDFAIFKRQPAQG